jgi:biotin carboxylase
MGAAGSLLILGGAALSQGMRCVAQAQARGMRAIVADTAENLGAAPHIAGAADEAVELAYDDPDRCVEWALGRTRSEPLAGVYGFREFSVESVARVAAALDLPGNPPEAVATVRDKYRSREALRAAGFDQPETAECASLRDAEAFADAHPGPWVVKPRGSMGSVGVAIVRDRAGLAEAHAALPEPDRDRFLIETHQAGAEHSAEGVFVDGVPHVVALTEKRLVGDGSVVELGHVLPAPADEKTTARAAETVERALRALGLRFGFFHVELWLDGPRVILGEVHARPAGDYIHLMVELVTSVEPYGAVFDQLVGRPVDPAAWRPRGAAAILYFTPPPGIVRAVRGRERVEADPACVRLDLPLEPGGRVPPLRESGDRPGFVLARAASPAEAWAAAERLRDAIAIDVDGS